MNLTQVSRTAILTLICHAIESEKKDSRYKDPMAILCLERLMAMASDEERRWILKKKREYEGIRTRDARSLIRRVKVFDDAANRFIAANPKCTLINLACGFDTRFWRIKNEKCRYIELDLPEVVELKKKLLKDQLEYTILSGSALDTSWIDKVTVKGKNRFLIIAEGLFMWFPPVEGVLLFKEIGERFYQSQLVLDMVPERYTKGIWKSFIRWHSRIDWGLDVSWDFGIQNPQDLEAYGNGLKVIGVEKGSAGPVITVAINA
jgi:O-methyltransferase involved in polyketide biosynthesis